MKLGQEHTQIIIMNRQYQARRVLLRFICCACNINTNRLTSQQNQIQISQMLSVTSPAQILNSPLNTSSAKYHWSFGKADRFKKLYTNCPITFYQIPNTKSKRGTSFGNGDRVSFALTTDSPSPYQYNLSSLFQDNKNKKKGNGFAKNRQECKEQGYILTGPMKNPSPNHYNLQKSKTIAFSMRPKTAYPREYFIRDVQRSLTPGPGTYEETINIVNPKGCATSRIRNANRTTIGFTTERFKTNKNQVPGPSHYRDGNQMKTGEYMLSINKSNGKRLFSHEKRELKLDVNNFTPGPGSYRKPSDFGHYEGQYQTIETNKSRRSSRPMTANR